VTSYMLDTNTLIYLIKNKPPSLAERINALGNDAVLCMSFFTFAELLKWGSPLSCSDYKILGSGLGDDVLEGAC